MAACQMPMGSPHSLTGWGHARDYQQHRGGCGRCDRGDVMNVSKREWSHPVSYGQAKARLIGRVRYREGRQQAAREREEIVFQLLVERGWDRWGIVTAIAKELGLNKSIVCRDRQRILRSMLA
jgi:hypothetical protein